MFETKDSDEIDPIGETTMLWNHPSRLIQICYAILQNEDFSFDMLQFDDW